MKTWAKLALGAGAGLGAYLAFFPKALATEDTSGETVRPDEALPPPPPPQPRPSAPAPVVPRAPGAPAPPPSVSPPAPVPAEASIGRRAVEVLLRYANKPEAAEQPKGSNTGPLVDQIMRGLYNDAPKLVGKPWCARTVRWAYEKAAQELGRPKPFANVKGTLASVYEWRDKFKDFYSPEPRTGNVGVLIGPGIAHVTLVSKVEGNTVYTVEGNHNDALMTVKRPKSKFAHFVDVEAFINKGRETRVAGLDLLGA